MQHIPITIHGEQWKLILCRSITHRGVKCDGLCIYTKREIRVDRNLKGRELVETVLHEMHHAAGWHVSEEAVAQLAKEQSLALEKVKGATDAKEKHRKHS